MNQKGQERRPVHVLVFATGRDAPMMPHVSCRRRAVDGACRSRRPGAIDAIFSLIRHGKKSDEKGLQIDLVELKKHGTSSRHFH